MGENSNNNRSLLICLTLTLVTLAVFYQVYSFEFINYDDNIYVYENQRIQTNATLNAIKWAFTTGYANFWHPLTWLSYMLDWRLFGLNPAGYHLTNLIFHIANTLMLFLVLKQMTNALWQSAFVAALFALHPLHIESVAWVSERKDVLSTFFWILTMWAYLRYVKRPNVWRYLVAMLMFALGLMSKPMLVTLPFVFLLLDYWPLDRISRFDWQILYRLIFEKIPFIVLSTVLSIIAFLAQQRGGSITSLAAISLKFRVYNALISYSKYICKMFWPSKLTVFYPHPGLDIPVLYVIISVGFLLAITVLVIRLTRNHRYLFVGWFWYLGTLVPVSGLVQVGSHAMADRYTYITLTGLFIMIAWGLGGLVTKWPNLKIVLWTFALMVLSSLAVSSYIQTRYWKDSMTLCRHALEVTKDNYTAHFCIAQPLIEQNRFEEAIWHCSEALRINPQCADAMNNLGVALQKMGKIDEAVGYHQRAVEINPHLLKAYNNLGMALAKKGKFDEAISIYDKALHIDTDAINIRLNLGVALTSGGKLQEAVKEYEKILSIRPQNAVAHNDLGAVLFRQGKFDEAVTHFSQAVKINPQYTDAKNNLSIALTEKQKSQGEEEKNKR